MTGEGGGQLQFLLLSFQLQIPFSYSDQLIVVPVESFARSQLQEFIFIVFEFTCCDFEVNGKAAFFAW